MTANARLFRPLLIMLGRLSDELVLHVFFHESRLGGEWFSGDDSTLDEYLHLAVDHVAWADHSLSSPPHTVAARTATKFIDPFDIDVGTVRAHDSFVRYRRAELFEPRMERFLKARLREVPDTSAWAASDGDWDEDL